MNEFLAELYNTAENIGADGGGDVEKLAQAQVLEQILNNEGLTIDDVSGEDILKVAEEIFGPDNEIVKEAMASAQEDLTTVDEDQEKLAEADFLGRAMAHAYVSELSELEKTAKGGSLWGTLKGVAKGSEFKTGLKSLKESAKTRKAGETAVKGAKEKSKSETARALYGELAGKKMTQAAKEKKKGLKHAIGGGAKTLGLYGGGAGAVGGAGYALSGKKKESAAVNYLAEKLAFDILAENGIDPNEPEKTALDGAVEERAWEMLQEAGYVADE